MEKGKDVAPKESNLCEVQTPKIKTQVVERMAEERGGHWLAALCV